MIDVIPIPTFRDNYIWCIVHRDKQHCILVDPGDAKPVLAHLEQTKLTPVALLITHHHWDHTGGIKELKRQFKVPVYGPKNDNISELTHLLNDGDNINVLDIDFDIIATPGHTLGHIAYYGEDMLFCGDTLFISGCGRLLEGTAEQMVQSLSKLAALPDETFVYCAHEYTQKNLAFAKTIEPKNKVLLECIIKAAAQRQQNLPTVPSTIAIEKQTNPFLRCEQASVRRTVENKIGKPLSSPIDIFRLIRREKDQF